MENVSLNFGKNDYPCDRLKAPCGDVGAFSAKAFRRSNENQDL